MHFKTVLFLVTFLATVSLNTAIKCYVCGGSSTSDCAKGKPSAMTIINCKSPGASPTYRRHYLYFNASNDSSDESSFESGDRDLQPICLKLYLTDYNPRLFERACGLFPSSINPCDFLQQHAHVVNCKSCKTDLCNQRIEYTEEDENPVYNYLK